MHDAYLASLDAVLVGPRRVRRDLLQEVADHLEDATAAYVGAGHDAAAAADLARRDLGTVAELAPGFQESLAVAASRRTALLLFAVLVVQPFLWDGGLDLAATRGQPPSGAAYRFLDVGIEWVGLAAMVTAVGVVLATGLGRRWFRVGRPVARWTARAALLAAGLILGSGVTMAMTTGGGDPATWAATAGLLGLPMAGVGVSARRTLAAC